MTDAATCELCQGTDNRGTVSDGACEPCFDRLSSYLGSRKCFPDDLPMSAAFDRMVVLDRTMAQMGIPEADRFPVCRNLSWTLLGEKFPEGDERLREGIRNAANLLEAQRRVASTRSQ
jgi:hypothetical protein